MKNGFSIELKIFIAATVAMLVLFTAVVGAQIFNKKHEDVTFVYNSKSVDITSDFNISDNFPEM